MITRGTRRSWGSITPALLLVGSILAAGGLAGCSADLDASTRASSTERAGDREAADRSPGEVADPPEGEQSETLWFDEEPEDPWDRYVWRSQRYVDDPVPVPPLGAEDGVPEQLWGAPNYCVEQVRERLSDLGFRSENLKIGPHYTVCSFQEIRPEEGLFSVNTPMVWNVLNGEGLEEVESGKFKLAIDEELYSCTVSGGEKDVYFMFVNVAYTVNFQESCRRAVAMRQIIKNVSGGFE